MMRKKDIKVINDILFDALLRKIVENFFLHKK